VGLEKADSFFQPGNGLVYIGIGRCDRLGSGVVPGRILPVARMAASNFFPTVSLMTPSMRRTNHGCGGKPSTG